MRSKKSSYCGLSGYCVVVSFLFLTFLGFIVASIIRDSRGVMQGAGLYFTAFLLFVLIQYTRLYTYPNVSDSVFEVHWLFYPFLTKKYEYSAIKKVVFARKVSYGLHYTMTIHLRSGKRLSMMDMICMPFPKVGNLIEDLRSHGVEVANQLRITDIS